MRVPVNAAALAVRIIRLLADAAADGTVMEQVMELASSRTRTITVPVRVRYISSVYTRVY